MCLGRTGKRSESWCVYVGVSEVTDGTRYEGTPREEGDLFPGIVSFLKQCEILFPFPPTPDNPHDDMMSYERERLSRRRTLYFSVQHGDRATVAR